MFGSFSLVENVRYCSRLRIINCGILLVLGLPLLSFHQFYFYARLFKSLTKMDPETFQDILSSGNGLQLLENEDCGYKYPFQLAEIGTDPVALLDPNLYEVVTEVPYESALESLSLYAHPCVDGFSTFNTNETKILEEASFKTKKYFFSDEQRKLVPYSSNEASLTMDLDCHAGYSYNNKDTGEKPVLRKHIIDKAQADATAIQSELIDAEAVYEPPIMLASNCYNTGNLAPIWIPSCEISILEAKFGVPLNEHLEQSLSPISYGKEVTNDRLSHFLQKQTDLSMENTTQYLIYWENFDSCIPEALLDKVFNMLFEMFDMPYIFHDKFVYYGGKELAHANEELFLWLWSYFIETSIMLPKGEIISKKHGILKGSYFTPVVRAMVNYLVVTYLQEFFGLEGLVPIVMDEKPGFFIPGTVYENKFNHRKVSQYMTQKFSMKLEQANEWRVLGSETDFSVHQLLTL